jgi:hypothetical protein
MQTVMPDAIALIASAVFFVVGFVAIAFWLLQR